MKGVDRQGIIATRHAGFPQQLAQIRPTVPEQVPAKAIFDGRRGTQILVRRLKQFGRGPVVVVVVVAVVIILLCCPVVAHDDGDDATTLLWCGLLSSCF